MRNIKLTLEYEGTGYYGFQKQRGLPTVQEALEEAVNRVTGEAAAVRGAGRTDAGVHARGQVVNFLTGSRVPVDRFPHALNTHLPADIVVTGAEEVDPGFDSLRAARSKTYSYTVLNREFPSPFWKRYALHVAEDLDVRAMAEGALVLVGRHDFSSFRAAGGSARSSVRTVRRFLVTEDGLPGGGRLIRFMVEADGFLYHMVRNMVGTLLEVGRRKMPPGEVRAVLAARSRDAAGPTAPAHGLCLEEVLY